MLRVSGFATVSCARRWAAIAHRRRVHTTTRTSPVCSWNEWDPLEEVIVGRAGHGAAFPDLVTDPVFRVELYSQFPDQSAPWSRAFWRTLTSLQRLIGWETDQHGLPKLMPGMRMPESLTRDAEKQLNNLAKVLGELGITVRRPNDYKFDAPVQTPSWSSLTHFNSLNPRDVLLIVGDEIIEAPMAQRPRYFEHWAYRDLIHSYFRQGARWAAAPKPRMLDSSYDMNYPPLYAGKDVHPERRKAVEAGRYVLTEEEPMWDAADFMRCGEDLIAQPSMVTNRMGIEWLRRHLGPRHRIHEVSFEDANPVHIDASLVPLRPGIMMQNPGRPLREKHRQFFHDNGWKILDVPKSDKAMVEGGNYVFVSEYVNINVLDLGDDRVVVEAEEKSTKDFLESLGFKVISVPFRSCYWYGGSIHCATSDIRRRGDLQCYFPDAKDKKMEHRT